MPREQIDLPCSVDYLSILDENGRCDRDLEPEIPDEALLRMHRTMLLSRRFDERLLTWQREGLIGTFAPVKGQEASQIGAVAALEENDWLVPSFREAAASLWRGTPLTSLILYNAGYNEGVSIPEDKHDLPISIPVASQIPHAVGLAYAAKYRGAGEVALTFFGDGATSEGDFHESLNFAGLLGAPVVFVCQNNHWAISVPREKQSASKTLAQKALAYGIHGIQVDGNDVLARSGRLLRAQVDLPCVPGGGSRRRGDASHRRGAGRSGGKRSEHRRLRGHASSGRRVGGHAE
jgi:TPP-dependent pyruvate/acetoin dehydrogenase alpha subunit